MVYVGIHIEAYVDFVPEVVDRFFAGHLYLTKLNALALPRWIFNSHCQCPIIWKINTLLIHNRQCFWVWFKIHSSIKLYLRILQHTCQIQVSRYKVTHQVTCSALESKNKHLLLLLSADSWICMSLRGLWISQTLPALAMYTDVKFCKIHRTLKLWTTGCSDTQRSHSQTVLELSNDYSPTI